jgi:UDP-glucose 4-epimerase
MRTIVVTGGCGYIGSHVARAFKQNGDVVHIIDRVFRAHTIRDIDGYMIADFASDEALAMIVNLAPDVVVHCAGTSLVGPSMIAPAEYYDNNISKTIRMLNVLVNHFDDSQKLPVIMFSSSAAVYGEPETWPVNEENDIQPISPYGATKAMTERILSDYFKAYSLSSMCFRYFNAAGAEPVNFDLGQEPDATHLVARALEASIAGRAVTINGSDFDTEDGTCVRDYVHVWDIARAHVSGASYLLDDYPQAGAHVYNLGTGRGTSNLQIVNYINDKYKLPFVNFGEPRKGDPATLVASAVRAKYQLHWEPLFSDTATIVDSAYNWYIKNV